MNLRLRRGTQPASKMSRPSSVELFTDQGTEAADTAADAETAEPSPHDEDARNEGIATTGATRRGAVFLGSLASEMDEPAEIPPAFARVAVVAEGLLSAYRRSALTDEQTAERLALLRVAGLPGIEWTLGATSLSWHRRFFGGTWHRAVPSGSDVGPDTDRSADQALESVAALAAAVAPVLPALPVTPHPPQDPLDPSEDTVETPVEPDEAPDTSDRHPAVATHAAVGEPSLAGTPADPAAAGPETGARTPAAHLATGRPSLAPTEAEVTDPGAAATAPQQTPGARDDERAAVNLPAHQARPELGESLDVPRATAGGHAAPEDAGLPPWMRGGPVPLDAPRTPEVTATSANVPSPAGADQAGPPLSAVEPPAPAQQPVTVEDPKIAAMLAALDARRRASTDT